MAFLSCLLRRRLSPAALGADDVSNAIPSCFDPTTLEVVSWSHSTLPPPVDRIARLALYGDVNTESALPDPAAGYLCDGAPIDITSSFLTTTALRPTHPLPEARVTPRL
jgi:hypothetical protein